MQRKGKGGTKGSTEAGGRFFVGSLNQLRAEKPTRSSTEAQGRSEIINQKTEN